jgi:hypothetical protein
MLRKVQQSLGKFRKVCVWRHDIWERLCWRPNYFVKFVQSGLDMFFG